MISPDLNIDNMNSDKSSEDVDVDIYFKSEPTPSNSSTHKDESPSAASDYENESPSSASDYEDDSEIEVKSNINSILTHLDKYATMGEISSDKLGIIKKNIIKLLSGDITEDQFEDKIANQPKNIKNDINLVVKLLKAKKRGNKINTED